VDEQRSGVDELAGHVHVAGLELVHVGQELRRDFGDGNVVDVDVLLADQVQQQVERAVVDLAHDDRELDVRLLILADGTKSGLVEQNVGRHQHG
jgi:hypothetical protein